MLGIGDIFDILDILTDYKGDISVSELDENIRTKLIIDDIIKNKILVSNNYKIQELVENYNKILEKGIGKICELEKLQVQIYEELTKFS